MSLLMDMATVTTLPVSTLEKLVEKEQMCILHSVAENENSGVTVTSVDMVFGTLLIKHEDNTIQYKFIPSRSFENNLKETVTSGESPLIYAVEEALKNKVLNTYKDLL